MPKLHLKRTPEEEAARKLRKEQKRADKRKRRHLDDDTGRKQRPRTETSPERRWASDDDVDDGQYGPQPSSSKDRTPQVEEVEERWFREKMFDAVGDEERLDGLEARFNDYAQVPDRWRRAGTRKFGSAVYNDDDALYERAEGDFLRMDPRHMDDDEYAEWVRVGMYRKTHAQEIAEQQRKKEARAARRAEEKARKAETARLEKLAEEERKQKKREKDEKHRVFARSEYDRRWKDLLDPRDDSGAPLLTFSDIPWPIPSAYTPQASSQTTISMEDLTFDAVSSFLLTPHDISERQDRKDKLREAFLRYHPDKFEGRFMRFVEEGDRENVRQGIGQVVRVLNTLMNNNA
ncbi:hypothetical protein BDN72DRAFT_759324 [Pluteus cervinus]|uniref:Uncharacterized protein n=1 Tax=Pluteus cervinus TaxID=181527 RepID=A0ACD3B9B1_9AGAR|nr:hypothetical protein BDN72DRAFT_759324 [Pluteus cervinus]